MKIFGIKFGYTEYILQLYIIEQNMHDMIQVTKDNVLTAIAKLTDTEKKKLKKIIREEQGKLNQCAKIINVHPGTLSRIANTGKGIHKNITAIREKLLGQKSLIEDNAEVAA